MTYFSCPELSQISSLRHGFFSREGNAAEIFKGKPVRLKQNHSNRVHYLGSSPGQPPDGDALVTDKKNIALAIITADCAPILFADPENSVIAAAHAGWRGARDGIVENTLQMMCDRGAERSNIMASIGPSIAQENYQVSPDFRENIIKEDKHHEKFFMQQIKQGKYLFDLKEYIHSKLKKYGLKKITILPYDTYADEEYFHSFRRATHRGEKDYGRQISVIVNL